MITGSIAFTGASPQEIRDAITEALTRIDQGNTSGFDHRESGSFHFHVDYPAHPGPGAPPFPGISRERQPAPPARPVPGPFASGPPPALSTVAEEPR